MTDPIPCNCWLDPQPSPTPCVFDDPSEIVDDCTYASNLASAGRPKTACRHYRSVAELTDEQLLELAVIDGYDNIEPGEYEAETGRAMEVYGSELLATMRAAIAADRAARPQPTADDLETRFRAWWAESYPNAPAGPHAVRSHVAFALHLLGGEVV